MQNYINKSFRMHKLSDKLSFKLSGMYLQAYEWEFISDEEYKRHKYPWNGHPSRTIDKKDNNPWGLTTHYWELVAKDSTYHNYLSILLIYLSD